MRFPFCQSNNCIKAKKEYYLFYKKNTNKQEISCKIRVASRLQKLRKDVDQILEQID